MEIKNAKKEMVDRARRQEVKTPRVADERRRRKGGERKEEREGGGTGSESNVAWPVLARLGGYMGRGGQRTITLYLSYIPCTSTISSLLGHVCVEPSHPSATPTTAAKYCVWELDLSLSPSPFLSSTVLYFSLRSPEQ